MELTLDQALQKSIEVHRAGQVQEADRLYTAVLKAQPQHPDANHNMGVLAVSIGKVQEALPFFKAALEANPNTVQFWPSYIDALIKMDRLADAKAVFGKAKSDGAKGGGFDQLEQRLEGVEPSNITVSQYQDPPEDQKAADKNGQHEPNWHKEQFRVCREIVVAIVAEVPQVERGLILWCGQVRDEAINIIFCQHPATDACNDQNR